MSSSPVSAKREFEGITPESVKELQRIYGERLGGTGRNGPLAVPDIFGHGAVLTVGKSFRMELLGSAAFGLDPVAYFELDFGVFVDAESFLLRADLSPNSYVIHPDIFSLRGSFALEETPIPGETLNPAIPDADKLALNAGLGYRWEQFSLEFGYQALFYKTRRVTNNELEGTPATGIPFSGAPGKDKYETFVNFVAFSLGYKF